ncbi:Uncharacterized protein APZ42_022400 [Daphnia magna]|uniref:Uncharacterized protein n=1 Tax=Daphnia magna TaxID=35525 RepID=A0A164VGS4_9CRUS|nr:Uncharacterized protein APZ42_022400 [Daphnia magna]
MKFSRQDFKKNAELLTTILSSTWKIGKLGRCKSRQLRKSMPTFCPKELTRRLLLLHVTSSLRTSSLGFYGMGPRRTHVFRHTGTPTASIHNGVPTEIRDCFLSFTFLLKSFSRLFVLDPIVKRINCRQLCES